MVSTVRLIHPPRPLASQGPRKEGHSSGTWHGKGESTMQQVPWPEVGGALGGEPTHTHCPQDYSSQPQTPETNSVTGALCASTHRTHRTEHGL